MTVNPQYKLYSLVMFSFVVWCPVDKVIYACRVDIFVEGKKGKLLGSPRGQNQRHTIGFFSTV